MKYIRKKINLENFTISSIPKSVLTTNSEGKTVIDTESPNYYYGKVPNYKIDNEGNFLLNPFGQKILNTINVDLFLTQKFDDMGLFTDKPYIPKTETLTEKPQGFNSFEYGRLAGAPVNFYYTQPNSLSGYTDDSLLKQVKSYRKDSSGQDIYVTDLNTSDNSDTIFNEVLESDNEKIKYKIVANSNNLDKPGIEYITFKNKFTKKIKRYGFPKKI